MQPSISVITLVTDDLQRAVAFYRDGLSLPTRGIVGDTENDTEVAFFTLSGNLQLAIWPRQSLANQLGKTPAGSGHLLSHNVAAEKDVDAVLDAARAAGATILKPPHWQPWGCYGGYFNDLDGHCWEVTFNPKYRD